MRYVSIHACPENADAMQRRWPAEHWADLLTRLILDGYHIVPVGTQKDIGYYEAISGHLDPDQRGAFLHDFVGMTAGLGDVVALWRMLKAEMLVCVNSGIMHLGVASGLSVVAIVGATPAHIILPPDDPKVKWIEDPALVEYDPQAEHGTYIEPRMDEITADMVMEKINELR